mgnify:CR=1 FL=1
MSSQLKLIAFLLAVLIPIAFFLIVYGWTNPSGPPPTGSGALYYDGTNKRVGINLTNPLYNLHVSSTIWANTTIYAQNFLGSMSASNITTGVFGNGIGNFAFPVVLNVGMSNVTNQGFTLYVSGTARFAAATIVGKLTVGTIDPVYNIEGKEYATYVASMTGVKEETTGKGKLATSNQQPATSNFYEYAIDFEKLEKGSDLWLWYQTVDFSKDNVGVLVTPYAEEANIYYLINGSKLIFKGNKPVEFSYRLTGKRHDWKNWPNEISD